MKVNILKNGFEQNLLKPAKFGDVGYDLVAADMKIVGVKFKGYEDKNDFESFYHKVEYIEYDTGIALEPIFRENMFDEYGNYLEKKGEMDITKYVQVAPRSSLSKFNLVLANHVATIDPNYRGTIKCRFKYIFDPEDLRVDYGHVGGKIKQNKIYLPGDKIAQAIFAHTIHPEINYVDKLSDSERGTKDFGSSGK